jgi:hypothetical protein
MIAVLVSTQILLKLEHKNLRMLEQAHSEGFTTGDITSNCTRSNLYFHFQHANRVSRIYKVKKEETVGG